MNREYCDYCGDEIKSDWDENSLVLFESSRIIISVNGLRDLAFCNKKCCFKYLAKEHKEVTYDE
ncbi:hypothetical protein [Lutibacter sp.]|uniref:hypothetical protein n=1 Tax=Lutibacter sp. TaxID=1925666 RepID=UPI00349FF156